MKKDFVILGLIFIPALCQTAFAAISLNDPNFTISWRMIDFLDLLKNLSPFLLGLLLFFDPGFALRIVNRFNLVKAESEKRFLIFLRLLGLIFLIASIASSYYLLSEILVQAY